MKIGRLLELTKAGHPYFQFLRRHRGMLSSGLTLMILLGSATAQPVTEARLDPVPFFIQPVSAVGESALAAEEGVMLNMAIRQMPGQDSLEMAELLDAFVAENPDSVWTPSLRMNLGRFYFKECYYTKAIEHWSAAWEATAHYDSGAGKRIADWSLAHYTRLLAALGRLDLLGLIIEENQGRNLDRGPLQQKYIRTQEHYWNLTRSPAIAYRCGWMVLDELARQTRGTGVPYRSDLDQLQGFEGCSMRVLGELGAADGFPLVAIERPLDDGSLPLNAVVHLRLNHYIAILGWEDGRVKVYDPLWGIRYLRAEVINAEASGFFMTAGRPPAGWRLLSDEETSSIVGRSGGGGDPGWFLGFPDGYGFFCDSCTCTAAGGGGGGGDGGNPPGSPPQREKPGGQPEPSSPSCGGDYCISGGDVGAPRWRVEEPTMNVWLHDTPLVCNGPFGEAAFKLSFKQRDEAAGYYDDVFGLGPGWNTPWLSWVDNEDTATRLVHFPGGGLLDFAFSGLQSATNFHSNGRLEEQRNAQNQLIGFKLTMPSGREYVYQYQYSVGGSVPGFFLSQTLDEQGFANSFTYYTTNVQGATTLRLNTVTDHINQTLFTLTYTNVNDYKSLVWRVTDRFNRYAQLHYVDEGDDTLLDQIIDAANLTNTVAYDANGWPEYLTTPYGTTTFWYEATTNLYCGQMRRAIITEPDNDRHMYMFNATCALLWDGSQWEPDEFPDEIVPLNLPAGTSLDDGPASPYYHNSFYWDPHQSVNIPTNLVQMTTNHFNLSRKRHWLATLSGQYQYPEFALSLERAPSPDDAGTIPGQTTWYAHVGKQEYWTRGTQIMPSLVARRLPDNSTWYEAYGRNGYGLETTVTNTYGTGGTTRKRSFVRATNGIDLLEERGNSNELLRQYTYNSRHQVLTAKEYADASTYYTTTFTYDGYGRPWTRLTPGGLTTTFSYGGDNYLSGTSDSPVSRAESFTWLNGRVRTHTDPRGLTVTKTWDNLDRLTIESFPGSTTIEYSYSLQPGMGFNTGGSAIPILDLCGVKDRLGKWTRYGYDRGRKLTQVKDARNNFTTYTYCGCGGPESVTDALTNTTYYYYDNAGRRTGILYPDLTSETFAYNRLGQLTAITNALGVRTFGYNNQGLLTSVTNAFGVEQRTVYDILDHPTSVTDANNVTFTQTFDWLGRMLTRTAPDSGVEKYLYTARGLVGYTNQLSSKVWRYEYDAALRKITETNANTEIIRYTYNSASDLLTLRDGKNQVTTWNYDLYGRVTNKLDQASTSILRYQYDVNSRLTNRWSTAKGNTTYRYDDGGNLTNIVYPVSPGITNWYDAVNRVTNRLDATGTTRYSYHANGQVLTEDNPWTTNDTVTFGYNSDRLRSSLSLQQPTGFWTNGFTYDAARRLSTVKSPAGTYTYTYKGPGTLVTNLALPNNSRITNAFDSVGRLTLTKLRTSGGTDLNIHSYIYNQGHQRTRQTRTDASYATYTYDNIGQLKSAVGTGGYSTENLGYAYDTAWNLNTRTNYGTPQAFQVNVKNELTNAVGLACSYDANGNMTNRVYDSVGPKSYVYVYDDENQLIEMRTDTSATPTGSRWRTTWIYDGLGRARKRNDFTWYGSPGGWYNAGETFYLYDGMRVIQERYYGTPSVSYTRGSDLSGSLEGAGGIGGLLGRSHGYSSGTWSTHNHYHADGNGNITYLVDLNQGAVAQYQYDPYGRTIAQSGALATANVYRFSSKEIHSQSGMYYYGFRFYEPHLQRWPNRDPLGEPGFEAIWHAQPGLLGDGPNLYAFLRNEPIARIDILGLRIPNPFSLPIKVNVPYAGPKPWWYIGERLVYDCEGECLYKICEYKSRPGYYVTDEVPQFHYTETAIACWQECPRNLNAPTPW